MVSVCSVTNQRTMLYFFIFPLSIIVFFLLADYLWQSVGDYTMPLDYWLDDGIYFFGRWLQTATTANYHRAEWIFYAVIVLLIIMWMLTLPTLVIARWLDIWRHAVQLAWKSKRQRLEMHNKPGYCNAENHKANISIMVSLNAAYNMFVHYN